MRAKGSVAALCLKHGITRHQFNNRLRDGWTIEETLGVVERVQHREPDHSTVNAILRAWPRPSA